ncbi:MAG: hypothetical protein JXO49_12670 [Deltaproteobacteria bacterium]|nr:hypothetical protein [Candidatus Anaeroferrophillus wilburensis]MBN2890182.1 hypothetical protein [Deltaproteobacteria bacterium]
MIIILVVGASGAGKDTLISRARTRLSGRRNFHFARRYVTRPPDDHEHNFFVDRQGFEILRSHGFFVADWQAHNHCYGIPYAEIPCTVDPSAVTILSISRQVAANLEKMFPAVVTVNITAQPEILKQRLIGRGREHLSDIEKRLTRTPLLQTRNLINFDNSGTLAATSADFISLLENISLSASMGTKVEHPVIPPFCQSAS